jgi:hypothetical protein
MYQGSGPQHVSFQDHLKIAETLGRPLNDVSACCLRTVMPCNENKQVSAVNNLFHKYLGTSVLIVYVLSLILFNNSFVVPLVPRWFHW